jgi:hypothetical protein
MSAKSSLGQLFHLAAAKSGGVDDYGPGPIPFVTSAEINNGVVAYVTPEAEDVVVDGPAIAISGLGHATVHLRRFLPKGNGGDSLTILKPKTEMSVGVLISVAAAFNALHKWRFSYGRKCSVDRLRILAIVWPLADIAQNWTDESKVLRQIDARIQSAFGEKVAPFVPAPVPSKKQKTKK